MEFILGLLAANEMAESSNGFGIGLLLFCWFIWLIFFIGSILDLMKGERWPKGWGGFSVYYFCFLAIVSIVFYRELKLDTAKTEIPHQETEKPELYTGADGQRRTLFHDGDTITISYEVNFVHGGYVGTGMATELIKGTANYTFGKDLGPGWNGLPRNADSITSRLCFRSSFGYEYLIFIPTKKMTEVGIVRLKNGNKGFGFYLVDVRWTSEKSLLVKARQTTRDEFNQLAKVGLL